MLLYKYFIHYFFAAVLIYLININLISPACAQGAPIAPSYNKEIEHLGHQFMQTFTDTLRTSENQTITYTLSPLNTRWSPPKCTHLPELSMPHHAARNYQRLSIKVQCHQPKPWSLYLKTSIEILEPVVITRQAVARGTLLTDEHLELKEVNIHQQYKGYYTDPKKLSGSEARYPLKPGSVVTPHQIIPNLSVKKGETVTVHAILGRLKISTSGVALAGGQVGDQIRVKNLTSNRIIDARIVSKGGVSINF